MSRKRNKWSLRRGISLVLAVLLIAGVVAGISGIVSAASDSKEGVSLDFERGTIDSNGEHRPGNGSLFTPEMIRAKGLEINLEFDSTVSYKVFFYDKDGNFRYATEQQNKSGEYHCPAEGYARIMITPRWELIEDDDQEISWYEVWGYEDQLDIRVDKNQKIFASDYTKLNLKNEFFTEKLGYYFEPSAGVNGKWNGDANNDGIVEGAEGEHGVDSYYFVNDGTASLLYIDSYKVAEGDNYGLQVCYRDGSVAYFGSTWDKIVGSTEVTQIVEDLPTVDDPLYLPKDTMIVIWGAFDGYDPADTIVCIY